MTTIATGTSSHLNSPRRSYITTTAFQNDIFSYTTSFNPTTFATTGTLTSLATLGTGTSANCRANTVLRENGKKLYPPGLVTANNTTYSAPNPGVTTYMVGVYDPNTFLSGYIDPNSKIFAIYNSDKPEYVPRGINPNGNAEIDQGAPVYTLGSVTAGTTVSAGTTVTGATGVVATAGQVRAATVTALTAISVSTGSATIDRQIDPSLGQVFTLSVTATGGTNALTISSSSTPAAGSVVYLIIATSGTHTTAMAATEGTNVQMNTIALGTVASKYFGITFVSDGTQLVQVGSSAAATAE